MSVSSTQSLGVLPQEPIHPEEKSSDTVLSVKRSFSALSSSSEGGSASLSTKKIRVVPDLPDFNTAMGTTTEMKEITSQLLPLFREPNGPIEQSLLETVKYIETHRDTLIEIAKYELRRSLYIHPPKDLDPRPFHIQVCVSDEGVATIYILPKLHKLGNGTTKRVRKAIDYTHRINVACATIRVDSDEIVTQTLNEYAIQKIFRQANDLGVYFRESSMPKMKIMMPYGNFGSLERCIRPDGHQELYTRFSAAQREEIFRKILVFIAKLHEAGYVVADIKPANILIRCEGDEIDVMITDFGTTYRADNQDAVRYVGSPHYMGPEFLEAGISGKESLLIGKPTDIYALGLTIWELFVGGTPPWMLGLQRMGLWFKPSAYRDAYDKTPKYKRGTIERLIYRMTHPDSLKRPSIQTILQKEPSLKLSSPSYQGIRLLTPEESASRFEQNDEFVQKNWGWGLPKDKVYCLVQKRGKDSFFLHTPGELVKVKPKDDGSVRVYSEKRKYTTYDSLEVYLLEKGLEYCLNFN